MSIFKSSICVALCLASFACRNKPQAGSRDGSGARTIDGTGHTGDVAPTKGTQGDPATSNANPSGSPSQPSSASQPAPTMPTGTTAPSGTGNSNTDMANPAGSGSAAGSAAH